MKYEEKLEEMRVDFNGVHDVAKQLITVEGFLIGAIIALSRLNPNLTLPKTDLIRLEYQLLLFILWVTPWMLGYMRWIRPHLAPIKLGVKIDVATKRKRERYQDWLTYGIIFVVILVCGSTFCIPWEPTNDETFIYLFFFIYQTVPMIAVILVSVYVLSPLRINDNNASEEKHYKQGFEIAKERKIALTWISIICLVISIIMTMLNAFFLF